MTESDDNQENSSMVMATSAVLSAATHILFGQCRTQFDSFMGCRSALDPTRSTTPAERCTDLAQSCITCSQKVYQKLAESPCRDLFRKFWRCLDNNDQNRIYCREDEREFYACTKEHLVSKCNANIEYRELKENFGKEEDRPTGIKRPTLVWKNTDGHS